MGGLAIASNRLACAARHQCQPISARLCARIGVGAYPIGFCSNCHMVQIDSLAAGQKSTFYMEKPGLACLGRPVVLGTVDDTMDAAIELREKL